MLTFFGSLVLVLVAAAALLLVGLSTLPPVTVRAEDLLPGPRPLVTELRPCTPCGRTTQASVHRDDRYTCLVCFAPHPAPVTS